MIRRGVQGLFLPGPSVVGGVDTLRFYAAGAVTSGVVGRSTRRGWRGGSSWPPAVTGRNVGHVVSPGSAQRPSRRK